MLEARHPVAIFANGLGDHLLVLPAIRALAELFRGRLALVAMPGKRDLFFHDVPLRALCETSVSRDSRGAKKFDARNAARCIGQADLVLSLNPWHSSSMEELLEFWKPSHSVGFHSSFQERIDIDFKKHSADLVFDVPLRVHPGLRIEEFAKPHRSDPVSRSCAQRIRESVPSHMRVLAVHADTGLWTTMGSRALDAQVPAEQILGNKMWPVEKFVALLDAFLSRHEDYVVFVLGGTDLHLGRGHFGDRVIPCCHLPIAVSLALVGLCDVFVGVDSCMLHAADLYRVPGVGLFGPTDPVEFGYRFGCGVHIRGGPFMEDIAEDAVLEALESLLP